MVPPSPRPTSFRVSLHPPPLLPVCLSVSPSLSLGPISAVVCLLRPSTTSTPFYPLLPAVSLSCVGYRQFALVVAGVCRSRLSLSVSGGLFPPLSSRRFRLSQFVVVFRLVCFVLRCLSRAPPPAAATCQLFTRHCCHCCCPLCTYPLPSLPLSRLPVPPPRLAAASTKNSRVPVISSYHRQSSLSSSSSSSCRRRPPPRHMAGRARWFIADS
jgi:hypothetical protein